MKKEEKFCPVLSLVVYYGKEPYDGATNLREMLEWTEETNELAKYIPNYQINVFDYHNQKNFGEFHTELQLLFEFLRYASDKDALKKLLADRKKDYYNVDNETYQMIAMLTNSKELLEYSEEHENEEGKDMCQAIKEMIEDGRAEGIAEGIAQDKINVAKNLLDILSDEVIAEKVGLDIEVVRELRK